MFLMSVASDEQQIACNGVSDALSTVPTQLCDG